MMKPNGAKPTVWMWDSQRILKLKEIKVQEWHKKNRKTVNRRAVHNEKGPDNNLNLRQSKRIVTVLTLTIEDGSIGR